MKVEDIDVSAAIEKVRVYLDGEKTLSPDVAKSLIKLLKKIISAFLNQKNLNSRNSSKPPSQDPDRVRKSKKDKGGNKEGEREGKKKIA